MRTARDGGHPRSTSSSRACRSNRRSAATLVRESGGEAGFEQTAPAPGPYVERRSVPRQLGPGLGAGATVMSCWCRSGREFLPIPTQPGKNRSRGDTYLAVTLSTASRSATAARRCSGSDTRALAFGAVVCAASAGVHAALVLPHSHESASLAVAFAVSAVALAMAGVALALDAGPTVTTVVALLLARGGRRLRALAHHRYPRSDCSSGASRRFRHRGLLSGALAAWALVRPPTRRSRS